MMMMMIMMIMVKKIYRKFISYSCTVANLPTLIDSLKAAANTENQQNKPV